MGELLELENQTDLKEKHKGGIDYNCATEINLYDTFLKTF